METEISPSENKMNWNLYDLCMCFIIRVCVVDSDRSWAITSKNQGEKETDNKMFYASEQKYFLK